MRELVGGKNTIGRMAAVLKSPIKRPFTFAFIFTFQYNQFFQPEKGIAMGSPISSTIAEIYLLFLEKIYIKQWLESKEITHHKRYVDDILIIFDQNKTNEETIINHMNNTDKHLEF